MLMRFFDSYSRGLIVHHWDTDGICSAGMLLSELQEKEIHNMSPTIGNFYLTENEIDEIKKKGYEFIVIVDICIPRDEIIRIKNATGAKIFIFDHHLQEIIKEVEHINPISEGKSPEMFPSATWVLSQWLGIDLLAVLGAVGDMESRIKENKLVYPEIENFLNSHSMKFNDLLRMVELIDSSYKVMDKGGVERAARFMMENRDSPGKIFRHRTWNRNSARIKREIERQLSTNVIEDGDRLMLDISTPFNIISTLTRRLARSNPHKTVIVINRGFFRNRDQIYIRGNNVQRLIPIARDRGYSAGGKEGVVGVILPASETDDFLSIIKTSDS